MLPEKQKYACDFKLNGNQDSAALAMPSVVNEVISSLMREAELGQTGPSRRTGY